MLDQLEKFILKIKTSTVWQVTRRFLYNIFFCTSRSPLIFRIFTFLSSKDFSSPFFRWHFNETENGGKCLSYKLKPNRFYLNWACCTLCLLNTTEKFISHARFYLTYFFQLHPFTPIISIYPATFVISFEKKEERKSLFSRVRNRKSVFFCFAYYKDGNVYSKHEYLFLREIAAIFGA